MRRVLAVAAAAVVMAAGVVAPAPRAEAVIGGCSTWVTTYGGFAGVTIYRGHVACYGSIPGKQYRLKMMCRLGPLDRGGYTYGGWKAEWSGRDSYNSCPWPWQASRADLHVQTR